LSWLQELYRGDQENREKEEEKEEKNLNLKEYGEKRWWKK